MKQPWHTLIIDDEKLAREHLKLKIEYFDLRTRNIEF
jgi:YesN/AraC family two-component response regulator